jgi:hypothetical protein
MNRSLPLAGDHSSKMPMKNQNENQPFEMITREITRIIFGDESASEMPLRLTRIALERYNVPEIINRNSGLGARGNGSMTAAVNGDAINQVASAVARILFGDEGLSEMHLRLTCIALARYHVSEVLLGLPATNGRNGSPSEHALAAHL